MEEYLYRYISFETFVGMIQSQSLTFVLPELWDDPKECASFDYFIEKAGNVYEQILLMSIYYKTFCQCWTKLAESDAMWRIYSYNNRAIRISIQRNKVALLDDIKMVDVEYTDDLNCLFHKGTAYFLKALSKKRTAFEHEKEVRLIKHYRFLGTDDFQQHLKAWCAISGHTKGMDIAKEMFPNQTLEEQMMSISKLLNIGKHAQKTKDISFKHIPDFIESVLVHPLAPEWYVNIVREYCLKNKIPFDGKSALYNCD